MSFKFSTEVRVRLPETDAFGIVFHGYFYTYFDVARMDYFRNLGLVQQTHPILAPCPIVHASADFRSPARFDDVLVVRARISEIGGTHFTFEFEVAHKREGRPVATGKTVHVSIDGKTWRPVRVPEEFRKLIRGFEGADLSEEGLRH